MPIGKVSLRKVCPYASLRGWGVLCDGAAVRGVRMSEQCKLHMKNQELLMTFLALKHFRLVLRGQYVLFRIDNTTRDLFTSPIKCPALCDAVLMFCLSEPPMSQA